MTSHQNTEATTATTELHEHAAEVDTRNATAYGAWGQARNATESARLTIRSVAGQRRNYDRLQTWTGTWAEALTAAGTAAVRTPADYHTHRAAEALTALDAAEQAEAEALAAYQAAEDEYEGWSRFFLVIGGHIHSSMSCSTCYPTTEFGWLPELSGLTESDAVAEYGAVLCSVCYPSAPVDQVGGKSDGLTLAQRAAAKAEKDAAKAERDAKKAAKALGPIRVSHGSRSELVTTIAAAKRLIKEGIDNRAYGYHTFATAEQAETEATLAAALRDRGVDIDTMIAKWTKAAGK